MPYSTGSSFIPPYLTAADAEKTDARVPLARNFVAVALAAWLSSLDHDAWLLTLMRGGIALGCLVRWGSMRSVARIGACLILLLAMGDHRSMTPPHEEESRVYG